MSQWYCYIQDQQYGPVDDETLEQWSDEGRLGPDDLVWREGMREWAPARTVPGLVLPTGPRPGPQRSGGLTALAVINFVLAGFAVMGVCIALTGSTYFRTHMHGGGHVYDKTLRPPAAHTPVTQVFGVVQAGLLIAAGVGYLRQTRWGRTLGNAYGVVGIVGGFVGLALWPNIFAVIGTGLGLVYPVLTLILLNTVLRNQFP